MVHSVRKCNFVSTELLLQCVLTLCSVGSHDYLYWPVSMASVCVLSLYLVSEVACVCSVTVLR